MITIPNADTVAALAIRVEDAQQAFNDAADKLIETDKPKFRKLAEIASSLQEIAEQLDDLADQVAREAEND